MDVARKSMVAVRIQSLRIEGLGESQENLLLECMSIGVDVGKRRGG